ncbi:MAG: hypothetical protein IPI77_17910 [Saprospiraceae bacterium]|nr:hypothetical protein [Saprospiraceae bacterium]
MNHRLRGLPVFRAATTYPCILIVSPKEDSLLKVTTVKSLDFESLGVYVTENHQSSNKQPG